jgi:hypothetical protein
MHWRCGLMKSAGVLALHAFLLDQMRAVPARRSME